MPFAKKTFLILLFVGCCLVACVSKKQSAKPKSSKAKAQPVKAAKTNEVITMPALSPVGQVAFVNKASRFAVLDYPVGNEPVLQQKLNVYRNKLKVAELLVAGPRSEGHVVADITAGEVQAGDEVRED